MVNFDDARWRARYERRRTGKKYDDAEPRDEAGRWTTGGTLPLDDFVSRDRAHEVHDELFGDVDPSSLGLGAEHVAQLEDYIHDGHVAMNHALREGDRLTPSMREKVQLMDDMQRPANSSATLYRGMAPVFAEELKVGTRFTDAAFVSTSIKPDTAERFGGTVARVFVNQGDSIAPGNVGESEVILARGTTFEVLGKTQDGKVLDLKVVR